MRPPARPLPSVHSVCPTSFARPPKPMHPECPARLLGIRPARPALSSRPFGPHCPRKLPDTMPTHFRTTSPPTRPLGAQYKTRHPAPSFRLFDVCDPRSLGPIASPRPLGTQGPCLTSPRRTTYHVYPHTFYKFGRVCQRNISVSINIPLIFKQTYTMYIINSQLIK